MAVKKKIIPKHWGECAVGMCRVSSKAFLWRQDRADLMARNRAELETFLQKGEEEEVAFAECYAAAIAACEKELQEFIDSNAEENRALRTRCVVYPYVCPSVRPSDDLFAQPLSCWPFDGNASAIHSHIFSRDSLSIHPSVRSSVSTFVSHCDWSAGARGCHHSRTSLKPIGSRRPI
jgi:hypothetical protein